MGKNKDRIKRSIKQFLKRLQDSKRQIFANNVLELFLEDLTTKALTKVQLNDFKYFIAYGDMEDLNDQAVIGLVSHLYALLLIDFMMYPYPFKSNTFYQLDKKADILACTWGFRKEVAELRKNRPQKLADGLFYNSPILKQSIPNRLFFDKQSEFINRTDNIAILYSHNFSVAVALEKFDNKIKGIKIITNKDI